MATSSGPVRGPLFTDIKSLKEHWGLFVGVGILLMALGIISICFATASTLFTILFLGIVLIAGGILKLCNSFFTKNWPGFFLSLLAGLFYLMAGIIFMVEPLPTALAATMLMGALFMVSGLFKIIAPLIVPFDQWGWVLFSGVVSLVLGVLVLIGWPFNALWVIGLFVGIDLIVYGWVSLIFGYAVKNTTLPWTRA